MKDRESEPLKIQEMRSCVGFALRRTTRSVTQLYDAALRPHGLRITQLPILVGASQREPVPLAPLAATLGMDRTTLLRNVQPLVRRKLLDFTPTDSGHTAIQSTAAGRALLARAYPAWKRVQTSLLARLNGERWRRTLDALDNEARGNRGR
jgi:DNA-binding MarR family transcriptional regulator